MPSHKTPDRPRPKRPDLHPCPVCGRRFRNPGALGSHMATVKDSDHQAARATPPDPTKDPDDEPRTDPLAALAALLDSGSRTPPQPGLPTPETPAPQPTPDPDPGATPDPTLGDPRQQEEQPHPRPREDPEPQPGPHLDPTSADPPQQEAEPRAEGTPDLGPEATPEPTPAAPRQQEAATHPEADPAAPDPDGVHLVVFDPPSQVGPLLPDPDPAKDPKRPTPSVKVPLAPIIGGGVTAALNGLILADPTDAELTIQETEATGFPRAVEAALEHYFPSLPLDHPLTAVIASGAALGLLVASKKGALAPPPPDETQPAEDPGDDPTPEPEPASPTGDPYWDSILAQAGGGAE